MDPTLLTEEQWLAQENAILTKRGIPPNSLTAEQRKTHPALTVMKTMYVKVPTSELQTPDVDAISIKNREEEILKDQREIDIVNKAKTTDKPLTLEQADPIAEKEQLSSIPLYSTDPFVEDPVKVVEQEDVILPVEAQQAFGIPENPLKRQVSSPGQPKIAGEDTVTGKSVPSTSVKILDHKALDKVVVDRANVQAVLRTRAELSKLYPDMTEEEQTKLLLNVSQKAITNAPDEKGVLSFAQEVKGQTPDVTDVQASKSDKPVWNDQEYEVYKILRANLTDAFTDVYAGVHGLDKTQAREFAKDEIKKAVDLQAGEEQWWYNPKEVEIYKTKEPEGLGILNYTYADGSTVEGLPAYGARVISAPANYVAGAIGAGVAYGNSELQNQRETSRLGAAGGDAGVTNIYEAMHAGGKGNAVSNRGFSEELYDYTVSANKVEDRELRAVEDKAIADGTMTQAQVDVIRKERAEYNYYLELGAQGAGLVLDIATPAVPGAGFITKTGELGIAVAKAGKTTGKVGGSLTDVTKAALSEYAKNAIPFRTNDIAGATEEAVRKQTADLIDVAAYTQKSTNLEDIKGYAKGELGEAHPLVKRIDDMSIEEAKAYTKGMLDAVPEDLRKTLDAPLLSSKGYGDQVPRLLKDTMERNPEVKLAASKSSTKEQFVSKNMDNPYIRSQVEKTFRKQIGSEAGQRMFRDAYRIEGAPNLLPSKYTALTPNLYATNKRVADDILEAAGKTDTSKLLVKLYDAPVEGIQKGLVGVRDIRAGEKLAPIANTAEQKMFARLTDEQSKKLLTVLESYEAMYPGNKLVTDLRTHIESKRIPLEGIRLLQDLHIESVGRAQFPTKVSSPEQIAKFQDTYTYNELVKPVDIRRGFIVNALNKGAREAIAKIDFDTRLVKTDPRLLSILDEAQQKVASLAKGMSSELRRVKESPQTRAFYGLPTTGELTDKQIIVRILVGKANDEEVLYAFTKQIEELAVIPKYSTASTMERAVKVLGLKKSFEKMTLPLTAPEAMRLKTANDRLRKSIAKDPDALAEHLQAYLQEIKVLSENDSLSVLKTKEDLGMFKTLADRDNVENMLAALYLSRASNIANQEAIRRLVSLEPLPAIRQLGAISEDTTYEVADIYQYLVGEKLKGLLGYELRYPNIEDMTVFERNMFSHNGLRVKIEEAVGKLSKQDQAALDEAITRTAQAKIDKYRLADIEDTGPVWVPFWKKGEKFSDVDRRITKQIGEATTPTTKTGYEHIEELLRTPKALENIASFMHSTQDIGVLNGANRLFSTLKETMYTLMLTLRPRFHGANLLTAPFIMYGNMGGVETLRSLTRLNKGVELSALANDLDDTLFLKPLLGNRGYSTKALVVDKAGRQYTYEEVAEMIRRNGLQQSQMSTYTNTADVSKIVKELNPRFGTVGALGTHVKELAQYTDSIFRASVLIQKLEDGLPPAQAIRQAREALFDYGRMSDFEKQYISSWWAFYSFTRASSLNLLEQVITNPQRVKNSIRFSKGANVFGDDDTDQPYSYFYEPERLMAKPLLALYKGADKESYATYGPSIPMVDTLVKLVNIATFEESPLENANPLISTFILPNRLGNSDTMVQLAKRGYVDPRLIARYEAANMIPMLEWYLGVTLNVRDARAGEPYYINDKGQHYTYTLADNNGAINEKAVQQLVDLLKFSNAFGASTVLNDWTPLFTNTEGEGIELNTNFVEFLGGTTDARYTSPVEQQAFRRYLLDADEKRELDKHNKTYKKDRK